MALESQGSTFSWGGSYGNLTGIAASSGRADLVSAGSTVVGFGEDAFVRNRIMCLAVDPGTITIRFFGNPGFSEGLVGQTNDLSFSIGSSGGGGKAILESFDYEASVGELVKGTATFRFVQ
jgi:hypothetical protein